MFRLAAAGRPLHHDFADKTAAVDGEMVDVISNMPLVRAFCGLGREHRRFDATIDREMTARRRSLLYLEKLRILHALVTIVLTLGLLAWAIVLWQRGLATTGDVVLACTLGLSVLHATRDLAVALVDVTQHIARLSEALATLLVPHELRDHPQGGAADQAAAPACGSRTSAFRYPDGSRVFERFESPARARPARRPGRPVRRRQVDAVRAAAALLRSAGRADPDRRPGHREGDAGEPARRHRGRAAGYLAVSPLRHGEHPLRQAGRLGPRRSRAPRSRPSAGNSSKRCRTASRPSSASAA